MYGCARYREEMERHRKSNLQLMQDNLSLIKEIKRQREENKGDKHTLQAHIAILQRNGIRKPLTASSSSSNGSMPGTAASLLPGMGLLPAPVDEAGLLGGTQQQQQDPVEALARNRERIAHLRVVLQELEGRVVSTSKPVSKEVLPPMPELAPASILPTAATTGGAAGPLP